MAEPNLCANIYRFMIYLIPLYTPYTPNCVYIYVILTYIYIYNSKHLYNTQHIFVVHVSWSIYFLASLAFKNQFPKLPSCCKHKLKERRKKEKVAFQNRTNKSCDSNDSMMHLRRGVIMPCDLTTVRSSGFFEMSCLLCLQTSRIKAFMVVWVLFKTSAPAWTVQFVQPLNTSNQRTNTGSGY